MGNEMKPALRNDGGVVLRSGNTAGEGRAR